jgi:hypothetical protein
MKNDLIQEQQSMTSTKPIQKEQAPQAFYMADDQSSTIVNQGHSEMEENLDNETFT